MEYFKTVNTYRNNGTLFKWSSCFEYNEVDITVNDNSAEDTETIKQIKDLIRDPCQTSGSNGWWRYLILFI